jgi:tetratricopeptide (TPR) repeat protein
MEQERDNLSQQNVEEIIGTTVYLETKCPGRYLNGIPVTNQVGSASGFFVERDKIATNFHVLHGATEISAKRIDTDTTYTIEGIIATNVIDDLVILKVAEKETPFNLDDSDTVQKGDWIYGLGYLGDKGEIVDGTIQGTRKRDDRFIVKAPFKDGWSGCPVLNINGKVVAVLSAGNDVDTIGYMVPSNKIKIMLTEAEHVKIQPLSAWQKRLEVLAITEFELYECDRWYKLFFFKIRLAWKSIKGTIYFIRATIKHTSANYIGAIAIYDKIITTKLLPFLGLAYCSRGMAKCGLENYQEALEDVNHAILLEPEDDSRYFSRGHVNLMYAKYKADQGKMKKAQSLFQDAISDLTEAINLNPEMAKYYNLRGWTKYLLGQVETEKGNRKKAKNLFQEAISDADEALQLAAKDSKYKAAFYHTRGAAKAGLSDHSRAIEDFNESIRLRPKKALYYHDRGLSKQALGQHEAAEADFAKAKELDSD